MEKAERLAKVIAKSGVASRREAEKLIESGRVKVDGSIVRTPVFFVADENLVEVDGKKITDNTSDVRLWKFYKPVGCITSKRDPKNRKTIFDIIKINFPRILYIGRLDLNSEGLLLLTNNGDLARFLELPKSNIKRTYKVRAYGEINEEIITRLKRGISINGVKYGSIDVKVISNKAKNVWLTMTLYEGKNREIRKVLDYFGVSVNRLIRVSFHNFLLGNLKPGEIEEVSKHEVMKLEKLLYTRKYI